MVSLAFIKHLESRRLRKVPYVVPVKRIVHIQLGRVQKRLAARGLRMELSDAAAELVASHGYDPVYGARPLKRYLQSKGETLIARKVIEAEIAPGSVMKVDIDPEGQFAVNVI